jgi:hypothetical protein
MCTTLMKQYCTSADDSANVLRTERVSSSAGPTITGLNWIQTSTRLYQGMLADLL